MMKKALFVSTLVLMFLMQGALFAQTGEKVKDTWYIGFGLGSGDVSVSPEEGTGFDFSDDKDSTQVTLQIGVGAIINPNLHIGFDISALRSQADGDGYSLARQINNYFGVLTVFPVELGFFLRGGGGISTYRIDVEIDGIGSNSDTVSGFGLLGGLGYAFWLGESFNLCLNFDYSYQTFDDAEKFVGNTSFYNVYLSFYWF
jgi:opacity protein-like surface antigen